MIIISSFFLRCLTFVWLKNCRFQNFWWNFLAEYVSFYKDTVCWSGMKIECLDYGSQYPQVFYWPNNPSALGLTVEDLSRHEWTSMLIKVRAPNHSHLWLSAGKEDVHYFDYDLSQQALVCFPQADCNSGGRSEVASGIIYSSGSIWWAYRPGGTYRDRGGLCIG